jgi:hypothetical protein
MHGRGAQKGLSGLCGLCGLSGRDFPVLIVILGGLQRLNVVESAVANHGSCPTVALWAPSVARLTQALLAVDCAA